MKNSNKTCFILFICTAFIINECFSIEKIDSRKTYSINSIICDQTIEEKTLLNLKDDLSTLFSQEKASIITKNMDAATIADQYHRKAINLLKRYKNSPSIKLILVAIYCEKEALLLFPKKANYWLLLGDLYTQMARLKITNAQKMSIDSYRKALKYSPNDVTIKMLLGLCLAETGKYAKALDLFENALLKAPFLMTDKVADWMNICYFLGEQQKRGANFYKKFLQKNPEYYYLQIFEALLFQAISDYDNAQKKLKTLISDKKIDKNTRSFASQLLKTFNEKDLK